MRFLAGYICALLLFVAGFWNTADNGASLKRQILKMRAEKAHEQAAAETERDPASAPRELLDSEPEAQTVDELRGQICNRLSHYQTAGDLKNNELNYLPHICTPIYRSSRFNQLMLAEAGIHLLQNQEPLPALSGPPSSLSKRLITPAEKTQLVIRIKHQIQRLSQPCCGSDLRCHQIFKNTQIGFLDKNTQLAGNVRIPRTLDGPIAAALLMNPYVLEPSFERNTIAHELGHVCAFSLRMAKALNPNSPYKPSELLVLSPNSCELTPKVLHSYQTSSSALRNNNIMPCLIELAQSSNMKGSDNYIKGACPAKQLNEAFAIAFALQNVPTAEQNFFNNTCREVGSRIHPAAPFVAKCMLAREPIYRRQLFNTLKCDVLERRDSGTKRSQRKSSPSRTTSR